MKKDEKRFAVQVSDTTMMTKERLFVAKKNLKNAINKNGEHRG
jgi:hypothetical protein